MTFEKLKWLLFVAAFLLIASGVYDWQERPSQTPARQEHSTLENPPAYHLPRWRAGRSQAYEVVVDSDFSMTLPGADTGQTLGIKIEARLDYQTLEINHTGVLAGMHFPVIGMTIAGKTDERVNRALAQPFRVWLSTSGYPRSFEFPASLSAEHRLILENLVRMFQLSIEPDDSWISRESNATGDYEAAYLRRSPTTLVKNKQRYLSAATAISNSLPAVNSEETVQLDTNHDWVTSMVLAETVTNSEPNGPTIEVNNRASLTLLKSQRAAIGDHWYFASASKPQITSEQAVGRAVAAFSTEAAERNLRAGIRKLDVTGKGRSLVIHHLRDILRSDGSVPSMLLGMMKTGVVTDRTRSDLYLALELAATPEAQQVLASVFTDSSSSTPDAMRAIVALGGVAEPTDDTLTSLWSLALTAPSGDGRDELPGTAALALGSLGRMLQTQPEADYLSLRSGLLSGASSASSTHQRAVFLHALGNTGDLDPYFSQSITPFLDDSEPEVRAAAASTLGRLGSNQAASQLLDSYKQEQNNVVRSAMIEALSIWDDPAPGANEKMRGAIHHEQDDTVRLKMARFLGKNIKIFPENRETLQELLTNETSKRVRREITEALYKIH